MFRQIFINKNVISWLLFFFLVVGAGYPLNLRGEDTDSVPVFKGTPQTFRKPLPATGVATSGLHNSSQYVCDPIGTGLDDGFFSLEVYKGKLYAGGFGYNKKPMLFRYPEWEVVRPGLTVTESICELREFKGYLYANTEEQGKIYRSKDGSDWQEVFDDPGRIGCVLREFKGRLYAAMHAGISGKGGKIYSSRDGSNWKKVFDSNDKDFYMKELVEYKEKLYALTINKDTGQGGYLTSEDGMNWQWNSVGKIRLFKAHVWDNILWLSATKKYSENSMSGIWKFDGTDLIEVMQIPGKTHAGEIIDFDGNLFVTTTAQWKGTQGGATLMISTDRGNSWENICTFQETESWNLAVYKNELYVSTKQDGAHGTSGRIYHVKRVP